MQVLERYKPQNLPRICNFEVNKAEIKTGFRFWFFVYCILLKNKNHQNKTNSMCIKHWNLLCFQSMSLNVFNTTLGKWYIPPSKGGPWKGVTMYIIYNYIPLLQRHHSNLPTMRRPSGQYEYVLTHIAHLTKPFRRDNASVCLDNCKRRCVLQVNQPHINLT